MSTEHPSTAPPVTTLLFDYGEVLSLPMGEDVKRELERLSGTPPTEFWDAYWAFRRDYDRGWTATAFWDAIADRLGVRWSPTVRQQLWTTDVAGWLRFRPESVDLVTQLAGNGTRLALLSNAPRDIGGALRSSPLLEGFDALYFSGDLGMVKPDPAVFSHVLAELDAAPERTLFVDDREDNIHCARGLGLQVHHYTGPAGLTSALAATGLL